MERERDRKRERESKTYRGTSEKPETCSPASCRLCYRLPNCSQSHPFQPALRKLTTLSKRHGSSLLSLTHPAHSYGWEVPSEAGAATGLEWVCQSTFHHMHWFMMWPNPASEGRVGSTIRMPSRNQPVDSMRRQVPSTVEYHLDARVTHSQSRAAFHF